MATEVDANMIALSAWGRTWSGIRDHLENARAAAIAVCGGSALLLLLSTGHASAAPAVALHLPADILYAHPGADDSSVVFSHETHFAAAGNWCTGCHPASFPMLKRAPTPNHTAMNAGASCGRCHDGKQSFGVRDPSACGSCHAGVRAAPAVAPGASGSAGAAAAQPRLPKPHAYAPGDGSPGTVTFRHKTHVHAANDCVSCHPKPFRMAAAPPVRDGGMHDPAACGACHDGKKAFASDDDAKCSRCHRESGARP